MAYDPRETVRDSVMGAGEDEGHLPVTTEEINYDPMEKIKENCMALSSKSENRNR